MRHTGLPAQIVASHEKICTPAGIAIAMLEAAKKLRTSGGRPVANMWCAHSASDRNPIPTTAATSHV